MTFYYESFNSNPISRLWKTTSYIIWEPRDRLTFLIRMLPFLRLLNPSWMNSFEENISQDCIRNEYVCEINKQRISWVNYKSLNVFNSCMSIRNLWNVDTLECVKKWTRASRSNVFPINQRLYYLSNVGLEFAI